MSGMRRSHALCLALGLILIYLLFFAGETTTDFRQTTEASLSRRRGVLRGNLSDRELTAQTNRELQWILDNHDKHHGINEPTRGDPADHKGHTYTSTIRFDDTASIDTKKPAQKEKPKYPVDSSTSVSSPSTSTVEDASHTGKKTDKPVDQGEELAREELQSILKKSPIIIFSKSYCPYSKHAKALLLETYTISPAPYVVELDQMNSPVPKPHSDEDDEDGKHAPTLGRKLQDLLHTLTGRRTVPNIMINSQSLGGSDDIAEMDSLGTLEEEIKKMGGNRIVSIEKIKKKQHHEEGEHH